MPLRLYSTLSRKIETFVPLEPGRVTFYCCGPTVYDYVGIHNARTFVVFDVIRRYLEYRGYAVRFAQNVTDIDDKIIRRANEQGADPIQWAKTYAEAYHSDMRRLRVRPPDVSPQATDTIPEIQALISRLMERNAAYTTESGVYFRVDAFPEYGKLSGRTPDDVRAGARVEVDEEKRDARDFALWKRAKIGEPWWESAWGAGRPGWHIECSAMVMKHLGETIDIHAGGADLTFPHHENEIAQSETATGRPFARYWLHGALMRVDGRRMGKSEGNFVRVRDALDRYPVEAVRLYLLSAHYRKPLEYSTAAIEEHIPPVRRLNACLDALEAYAGDASPLDTGHALADLASSTRERLTETVDDDLNFAGGLGVCFQFVTEANRFLAEHPVPDENDRRAAASAFRFLEGVVDLFGLRTSEPAVENARLEPVVRMTLALRTRARSERNWHVADALRRALTDSGVVVQDTRDGSTWSFEGSIPVDDAVERLVEAVIALRTAAQERQDGTSADELRDALASCGIALTDDATGTRWEWSTR
jgi:cysteinyl-tRNA synthetase